MSWLPKHLNEILGMLSYLSPYMLKQVLRNLLSYRMTQIFKYKTGGILRTFRTCRRGRQNNINMDWNTRSM